MKMILKEVSENGSGNSSGVVQLQCCGGSKYKQRMLEKNVVNA